MSGVRYGTRLEQLERLRTRIDLEIAAERRLTQPPEEPKKPTPSAADILAELGVTARQVKVWAHAQGLVDHVARGRVPLHLVTAYAEQHTPKEQPR